MVDQEKLRDVIAVIEAVIAGIGGAAANVPKGQACALGTLMSMLRNYQRIAAAITDRTPNQVDHGEIERSLSGLKWLSHDPYVLDDFPAGQAIGPHVDYPAAIASVLQAARLAIMPKNDA
ncbi:hypothetical protein [Asticcacaulis endophyticus]|uniref:Uncharacterized protein n=1 Tax=Asticcacaulis endophyticus TaxID=1395890 RepID=A0A918UX16_9CAUL|nr:hypothetical protein [Asticcacaulis endophyticus]GGZ39205.1 hypothetical protein GCM10011273_27030 [Asticcacaulis endophyticus]